MSSTVVIILVVIALVIINVIVKLFTMTLNDFLEKTIKKYLWLWLPFHALKRLSKEFGEKYLR